MPTPEAAVAWDTLSPLPPVRSGIADYTVDLLGAVEEHGGAAASSFRVVRVPGQQVAPALVERWQPVDVAELGAAGRVPVYHLGNNTYHEAIWDVAMEQPGIVVLHDVFLHHLLQERTLAKADLEGYVEALSHDHGWIGRAVAMPPRWSAYGQAALFALPAHRGLLQRQRGVVVHSAWARRLLLGEDIGRPVRRVPMVMPAPDLTAELEEAAAGLRRRWGVGDEAFLLGSFGFQTPIKRTASAIRALAGDGLERAHLVVAGEPARGLDLEAVARDAGVAERVHLVGFLAPGEFSAAIRACDLTVNLRYPTAGETSASLLRILALGRAALVSDYAQFRDAGDGCLAVPLSPAPLVRGSEASTAEADDREVAALAATVRELASAPERLAELGARARRRVLEEHAPEVAATAFLEAVGSLAEEPLPGADPAPLELPRPTTLTWGRLESELEVEGEEEWSPGELRDLRITLRNRSFARLLAARRGPGGVMLEVQLRETTAGGERDDGRPGATWIGLPRDLEPGESCRFELSLRRPLAPTSLVVEPHVVGGRGFSQSGGPRLERSYE